MTDAELDGWRHEQREHLRAFPDDTDGWNLLSWSVNRATCRANDRKASGTCLYTTGC